MRPRRDLASTGALRNSIRARNKYHPSTPKLLCRWLILVIRSDSMLAARGWMARRIEAPAYQPHPAPPGKLKNRSVGRRDSRMQTPHPRQKQEKLSNAPCPLRSFCWRLIPRSLAIKPNFGHAALRVGRRSEATQSGRRWRIQLAADCSARQRSLAAAGAFSLPRIAALRGVCISLAAILS